MIAAEPVEKLTIPPKANVEVEKLKTPPKPVIVVEKLTVKPQVKPIPKEDIQDLVFLHAPQPLRMRLHVSIDGKAPSVAWDAFLDKLFAYYDLNNDGYLSQQEATKIMPPNMYTMGFNLIFNGGRRGGGNQRVNFADIDTNKDGKISREEFGAYFRKSQFLPMQVQIQPPNRQAEQYTDALYKHLNKKGDGKLTPKDLQDAWTILLKLDNDEDEIITAQELMQRQSNPFYGGDVEAIEEQQMAMRQPQTPPPSAFISLDPSQPIEEQVKQLQGRLPLAAWPAGFGRAPGLPTFVTKIFEEKEKVLFTQWLQRPPDLEFDVQLGDMAEGVGRVLSLGSEPAGVRLTKTSGNGAPYAKAAKSGADGILRITMPDALLEMARVGGQFNRNFDGNMTYYLDQFKMAAGDQKYLTKDKLQENPYISFLVNVFEDADRNGDGKLTLEELKTFFEAITGGPGSQTYVSIVDQGRSLFSLIDTNHDNRLSQREMLNFAKNFSTFDKNGDGSIERTELPRQFRLSVSQGPPNGRFGPQVIAFGGMGNTLVRSVGKGPIWFQRMDRNKDGDVSRREFLGSPEEFKEIDEDGDGLISAEEALKYDLKRKTAKK
jgi:Ca2+-binding EF-hand superfamily protein